MVPGIERRLHACQASTLPKEPHPSPGISFFTATEHFNNKGDSRSLNKKTEQGKAENKVGAIPQGGLRVPANSTGS